MSDLEEMRTPELEELLLLSAESADSSELNKSLVRDIARNLSLRAAGQDGQPDVNDAWEEFIDYIGSRN